MFRDRELGMFKREISPIVAGYLTLIKIFLEKQSFSHNVCVCTNDKQSEIKNHQTCIRKYQEMEDNYLEIDLILNSISDDIFMKISS